MRATTYQHCYRVLQAHSGCSLAELRLAYRRRARHCHPDRLPPDGAGSPGRDDAFKQVVLAYRLLLRFHMRHGELPPPYLAISENAAVVAVPTGPAREEREDHATGKRRRRQNAFSWLPSPFHRMLVAAFIGSVCVAAVLDRYDDSPNPEKSADISSHAGEPAANNRLAVGMDPQSVVDIQGVPSYTKGSIWFYGDSGVIFDKGCVVGWENQPPFPLRTLVSTAYLLGNTPDNFKLNVNNCAMAN